MHPVLVRAQPLPEVPAKYEAYSWIPFTPETVEERVRAGQTVFIDFTAEWCWTCKVNERVVLSQQVLRDRFADEDVAMVKADWTHRNPQITQMLQAFGRSGVPLYVLFPGGQLDAPIVLPELISEEIVLDALSRAAALRVGP
ncbi:MAG: thioredoxin family protein, partial [Candidatus Latescibacterota bacterium]|nr:thioredoxin family protein [Candidatus Latescibacterota bacterium]